MTVSADSVRELLSSENFGDRLRAVNQIRELEPKTALELVQIAISDKNARVRYSAVSQFDTLGSQDLDLALDVLRKLLKDPEPDVQAAAADCLGALKLQAAFEDIKELYETTPEWLVQFSILSTLGSLGDPRGFDLLKEALNSDNGLVQTAAISSLGELGHEDALNILAPYVSNPDWQIRYRLVQALVNLADAQTKPLLEQLAKDEVEVVANEAKQALT
ncbi:HEAT repeat domain-containing protein [Anabaena sp. FACHB-1237]|uniref:phycobilisome degradation protein NblB n=1 Tax=Anabaena sp. FACHB-1237 TaxID=2692769 RepID=UPI0016804EBE|nr:HEAT repeat domain-containing protein [Anabaena sp. FACHB-1237]MBD2137319.1 HEAT repeat domain-containing protein [Anabaena sp. FACHB-1237]